MKIIKSCCLGGAEGGSVVEYSPTMSQILNLIPSSARKKKKKQN